MGGGPTGRRRRWQLLQITLVFTTIFAAGLVSAGVVSGAGPLAALSTGTDTSTSESTTSRTTTDESTTTESTETTTDTESTESSTTETSPLPAGPPTLVSDKDDYMPGETVTLTGEKWVPGDVVRIAVNDDQQQPWTYQADVVASLSGTIYHQFQLPTSFAALYTATATGPISGSASTTFTDGNVKVASANGRHFDYQVTLYSSTDCTTGADSPTTKTADANGSTSGVGANQSLLIVANLNANAPNATATFSHWTRPGNPAIQLAPGYSDTNRTICVVGFQSGSRDLIGNYTAPPVNTAPTANNAADATSEDTPKTITLSGSDAQQCELGFSIVSGPANGSLGAIANNTCTSGSPNTDTATVVYTPNSNYSGSDTFTYRVNDGTLDSNTATVSITVNAVDDPPVAADDSATVTEDSGSNAIDVLANDTDPDGGPKTVQAVTQPTNGSASITGGGTGVSYTPNANYCNGGSPTDNFTYTLDGGSTATVAVTVTCVDDPPMIAFTNGDTAVDEGQTKTYTFSITDPDSSSFTYDPGYPTCGSGGALVGTPSLGASSGSFQCSFPDGPATPTVAAKIRDASSASNEATRGVTVANVPPTVTVSGDAAVDEGQTRTYTIATSDPGDEVFALTAHSCGANGVEVGSASFDTATGAGSFQCRFPDGPASSTVSATVSDGDGGSDQDTLAVTVANVPPVVTLSGPTSANEGQTSSYAFTTSDPGLETFVLGAISCGASGGPATNVTFAPATGTGAFDCPFPDDNPTATASDVSVVSVTVSDGDGGSDSDTSNVTVSNLAPVITGMSGPSGPIAVGGSVSVTTSYTDAGTPDTHTCRYTWDDGSESSVSGGGSGTGSCTGTHTYAAAGVYTVGVTVTDDDTGSATSRYEFVVVFDPSAGFVTGGGWINSPAGAYRPDPSLIGRANFGFVSKYKKGASLPEGQTEFQFHAGSLNFHSETYQWLVVSGPRAQYKGTGKVNGTSGYGFLVTATDGQQTGGGGTDRFRIKIWRLSDGSVVYDNSYGASDDIDAANPQMISGGSIVIHSGK
jgi:VCBS repeat-containing protein